MEEKLISPILEQKSKFQWNKQFLRMIDVVYFRQNGYTLQCERLDSISDQEPDRYYLEIWSDENG